MHIFNSSGVLVFDSNQKAPRIRQIVTVPYIPPYSEGNKHNVNVISHTQGTNPWMLANFTRNAYGYVYQQEYEAPLSDLMTTSIRSDTTIGNRIIVQNVRLAQIGSQGAAWSYAPMPVALIP